MVMTMSAAWTSLLVSGLGNSCDRSRPISAMAWTTAGLSWLAGWDPAERTCTPPPASWSSRAAAIWERPALWVQTKSTSGMSVMGCFSRIEPASRSAGGLDGADDRCVHAGGGLVGEGDRRLGETGGRQPVEVFLAGQRAGDAPDVG